MTSNFNLSTTRGLILDCDGTLLDTMPAWNELEAHMTELTGVPWTQEQYEEIRAVPLNEGARIYHERYGLGASPQEVLDHIDGFLVDFYRERSKAKPGVKALLKRAQERDIPCVVVTSSPVRYVLPGFECAGIDGFFRRVITTDDVELSKQDPRIWQLALDELGAKAEDCCGLDDSVYAVKVMRQVGIRTIGCYDCEETGSYEQLAAVSDIAVRSLEELL